VLRGERKRRGSKKPRKGKGKGDRHGAKMAAALMKAIKKGGIRDLTYEEQILVARAIVIIKAVPDEVVKNDNPKEYQN
jgi:hypothetical protein